MAKDVKPKRRCCKSRPRCKRCPTVLKRLERAGLADRLPNGRFVVAADKKQLKRARRGKPL